MTATKGSAPGRNTRGARGNLLHPTPTRITMETGTITPELPQSGAPVKSRRQRRQRRDQRDIIRYTVMLDDGDAPTGWRPLTGALPCADAMEAMDHHRQPDQPLPMDPDGARLSVVVSHHRTAEPIGQIDLFGGDR